MSETIQALSESMNMMFQQASEILRKYGIEIYMYKVKLYVKEAQEHKQIDEDCPDASLCIDWVVRIKCDNDYICNKLRESYMKK